jgi:hypothetical protein
VKWKKIAVTHRPGSKESLAFFVGRELRESTRISKKLLPQICADERRWLLAKEASIAKDAKIAKEEGGKAAVLAIESKRQAILRRTTVRRLVLGRDFSETTVSTTAPGTRRLIRRLVEVGSPARVSGVSPNKALIYVARHSSEQKWTASASTARGRSQELAMEISRRADVTPIFSAAKPRIQVSPSPFTRPQLSH